MDERIKIFEEVNPIFTTAQSCLRTFAGLGDRDSILLAGQLGFNNEGKADADNLTPEMKEFLEHKAAPGFKAMIEARFLCSNQIIKDFGYKQVLDLPCGYTPRGIKLSQSDVKYYGCDLPVVIRAMMPAFESIAGRSANIEYHEVDATNYSSVKEAVKNAGGGEVLVTTEGLLMYLTQSELEEVFSNIRRILAEYGGRWITTDNEIVTTQNRVMMAIAGENISGSLASPPTPDNDFFRPLRAEQFVKEMGFDLEFTPASEHMPGGLSSLKGMPNEQADAVLGAIGEMRFWVMTVRKEEARKEDRIETNGFKAEIIRDKDALNIRLSGRLDTITSPDLLTAYRKASEEGRITAITVDMEELDYVSSAGVRVLLIMHKELKGNGSIKLTNMNAAVREILDTMGFSELFEC
ncbi:MAG: STAS domain-containing protein [Lachnospiraceae bacterium]|nr:STAS domain-containing protein [Lachnospiraceae bacterium]